MQLSKTSFMNLQLRMDKHILPFFGQTDVLSINYKLLDEYLQKMSSLEPKLSIFNPSTNKIKLQLLHMGFEFGLGENLSISRRGKYLQIGFVNFWCTKSNFLNC